MAPPPEVAVQGDDVMAEPACPCGGDMWFLRFGYESWVCRRNTRHWFKPAAGRWSGDAQALVGSAGD
jgi:hypothetical protein